eukprot:jgi/Picsp_1/2648/NSC_00878-R1_nad kinase 1
MRTSLDTALEGIIEIVEEAKRAQIQAEEESNELRKECISLREECEKLKSILNCQEIKRSSRISPIPQGLGLSEPGTQDVASEECVPLALRRSHTYAADGRESNTRNLIPDRHDSRKSLDLSSSLGLWFMITQLAHSKGDLPFAENSSHHATVSFADDGTAGVGATAAAAVAIAMAKSWASSGSKSPSQQKTSAYGGPDYSRARFKLVAAVPRTHEAKNPMHTNTLHRGNQSDRSEKSISGDSDAPIPLDLLSDDAKASEWAAYGSHVKLEWISRPKRVLIVFKPGQESTHAAYLAICYLIRHAITVFVEPKVHADMQASLRCRSEDAELDESRLKTWDKSRFHGRNLIPDELAAYLDLIVTVGGDGTVLWTCSILGALSSVPPIIPIAMGSLGFMTPFPVNRMEKTLERVLSPSNAFPIMLRHRLQCRVTSGSSLSDLDMVARAPCGDVLVLNELVIDRGMSACLTNLECYVDQNFVTNIQGDGLIVSTPTGSTAYNLAAGGSMVHPAVPCILFTPICAHTLSSRPLVFPEHVVLRLRVPTDSRGDLYCSFDGKGRRPLRPGDSVLVHLSKLPVPMVCNLDASHDWFMSVREGLDWNRRHLQGQSE